MLAAMLNHAYPQPAGTVLRITKHSNIHHIHHTLQDECHILSFGMAVMQSCHALSTMTHQTTTVTVIQYALQKLPAVEADCCVGTWYDTGAPVATTAGLAERIHSLAECSDQGRHPGHFRGVWKALLLLQRAPPICRYWHRGGSEQA